MDISLFVVCFSIIQHLIPIFLVLVSVTLINANMKKDGERESGAEEKTHKFAVWL